MSKIPSPCPQRVRRISGSFAWLDHRVLRDGHFAKLSRDEIALYTFLVLVGNCDGVSYYGVQKICDHLAGMGVEQFLHARSRLIEVGLICFRPFRHGDINGFYQVLAVEEKGRESHDDSTGCAHE
jgi:hypothetical protein